MGKQRENMIPGKRYRGYGYLNEFKEFCFEPEDTGSRAGVVKQIFSRDGVSLSETNRHLLIHIKMEKCKDVLQRILLAGKKYNIIVKILQDYDF